MVTNAEHEFEGFCNCREWCLWYLRIFLALSETGDLNKYENNLKEYQTSWRRIKNLNDHRERWIIEIITAVITEAVARRTASPLEFESAVHATREWLSVLENTPNLGDALDDVAAIDNAH